MPIEVHRIQIYKKITKGCHLLDPRWNELFLIIIIIILRIEILFKSHITNYNYLLNADNI